jgi:hypothetical protein
VAVTAFPSRSTPPVRDTCHHVCTMTQNKRRLTITSRGEVTTAPYGVSRWSNPKTYTCAHPRCPRPASILKPANAHATQEAPEGATDEGGVGEGVGAVARAHNCCGAH